MNPLAAPTNLDREMPLAGPDRAGRPWISLKNADFRLVWTFHVVNFLGISMEMLAIGWMVLEVTDSAFWVGAVAGVRGIGQIGFGLVGGMIADRYNRRFVALVAQLLRATVIGSLGALVLAGALQPWHLILGSLLQGLVLATVTPAGEAMVYDTVGPNQLLNAVAVKMGAFSLARIPASLAAGALLASVGPGPTLLLVAFIFALSPISLVFARTPFLQERLRESPVQTIAKGVNYAVSSPRVRPLLLFSLAMELFAFSYHVLLPVIARDVLAVGPAGLGVLSAAASVGGIVATAVVASLGDYRDKGRLLVVSAAATAILIAVLGATPWFAASMLVAALLAAALLVYDSMIATMFQLVSSNEMRGRVLGLYGLTWGFMPIGGFFLGSFAASFGAPFALALSGGLILLAVAGLVKGNPSLVRGDSG